MKKLIFVGILGLFVLGSCNNSTVTHTHDEHNHAAEGHNHEAEGPDHSHEGECSGEHNHEAADEYNEAAEAHSDEIILPKAKAEAAGVKVSVIEPAPFQQVIKTSGQVLAAQGDESVGCSNRSRCSIFPWKSNGRNERRQRHSASHYFFKEYRRW